MSRSLLKREYTYQDLFEVEQTNVGRVLSVSSLTFYNGLAPVEFIQRKVHEIVARNPWLDGRLVRINNKVVLKYCVDASEAEAFPNSSSFGGRKVSVFVPDEALFRDCDDFSPDYHAYTRAYLVKKGFECVDRDEPLFHVAILKHSETKFALLFSISHTLVDGHTYYSLYSMLSSAISPRSLIVERNFAYRKKADIITHESESFFKSSGFVCNVLGHLLCNPKPQIVYREVNFDYVSAQKMLEKDATGTMISTNDIVCSNFLVHSNVDVGFIAVNFRNRIDGATTEHAGESQSIDQCVQCI